MKNRQTPQLRGLFFGHRVTIFAFFTQKQDTCYLSQP